jgi:addiction module HigA family antidote
MAKSQQTPESVLMSLMAEYQLNPYSMAKSIKLSYSAVRQIITGKTKITVSSAMRLGKFFGKTPEFWLDLQQSADMQIGLNDKKLANVIKNISKVQKPVAGATAGTKKAASSRRKATGKKSGAKRK